MSLRLPTDASHSVVYRRSECDAAEMQIQIHTDHNIHGYESAAASVRTTVENALSRFSTQITRVEVHLGDENASKRGGDDKRCMMEARLEGHAPIAVTERASTIVQAISGAAEKLVHRLERTLGRLHNHRGNGAMPSLLDPDVPETPDRERLS